MSADPIPIRSPSAQPIHAGSAGWEATLARNWRYRPLAKTAGITVFIWLFFVVYLHLLHHPARPVVEMPLTPLDHWIPAQPWAFWPYVSLWIYVGLAPALLPTLAAGMRYGLWAAALCASGLLFFWLWPTKVPPSAEVLGADAITQAGLELLRGIDAAGNACPSLHVATAVFSGIWLGRLLAHAGAPMLWQSLNAAWLLAIAWSTIAVRQHVVWDVLAGAALGAIFGLASGHFASPLHRSRPDERLSFSA